MSETESVQPTAPEAAPEAAAPSIRDLAAAAYDQINAAPEGETPEVETQGEGPARDERGRFAPKNSDQTPAEQQVEQAPETPAIEMPSAWSAQHAERWKTLPREVQEHIAAREAEVHKAISEKGQELSRYKPLEDILAPRRQALAAEGLNEAQVVQAMFAIRELLHTDPVQAITLLARQSGVNLSQLAGQPQQATQEWVDPQVAAATQRVEALERYITQQQQAAQQAETQRLSSEIASFAQDKPDFEQVRPIMGHLIGTGIAKDMPDAYERARWMVPEIREKLLAEQRAAEAARIQEDARKRAEEAKRASAINIRGSGEQTASAPRTMRETLAATYDRVANA